MMFDHYMYLFVLLYRMNGKRMLMLGLLELHDDRIGFGVGIICGVGVEE